MDTIAPFVQLSQTGARAGAATPVRVAIIMRSKDEQPHVQKTLENLEKQNYRNYVLYSVDSGSTDGTLEVVQIHNPHEEKVLQIAADDYVPGKVLNWMIEKTSEPIIVFLNADAIPQDEFWLQRLVAPILNGEVEATMSRQIPRPSALFIVKYDMARGYARKNAENGAFFSAVACAFKRELWEQMPFPAEGYAEDLAWAVSCQFHGARFRLVSDSVVEHSHNYSLSGLYRKRFRHGVTHVRIFGEKPNLPKQLLLWFRECCRDLSYAVRTLRIDTIPYNTVYRTVIHIAYYMGKKEGRRRYGYQAEEHREID